MQQNEASQCGFTLLEVMLVLAIAATIIVSGISLYQRLFRTQTDMTLVQANVDRLFQAAADFYQANCIQYKSEGGLSVTKAGALDPTVVSSLSAPYPVAISTALYPDFLSKWPLLKNKIVDDVNAPAGSNGYIVQFNPYVVERKVETTTALTPVGNILLWRIQVAVLVSNTAQASQYVGLMGATCRSSLNGSIVTPCTGSSTGNWIVWERLPSLATTDPSGLWQSMQTLKQFTQMYTVYPMTYLTGGYYNSQYYLCGG